MSSTPRRQINQAGLKLIQTSEGFQPLPRPCPAGRPTVGYGHVVRPGESFTRPMSREEALDLLQRDLTLAQEAVERLVQVPLEDNQFAALVSFVFNLGPAALASSSLIKKLNAGDYAGAAKEFPRWDKITLTDQASGEQYHKVLPGLAIRRRAEQELFAGGKGMA